MSKVFLVSVGGTRLKISHREIQQRANMECIEYWIILRQLRFIGHVIRMSPCYHTFFPVISYRALQQGQWSDRRQKKHLSSHIMDMLKKCCIPPDHLEVLAADRDTRRATCKHGLAIFRSNHTTDAPKTNKIADMQHLHPHPVLPVTSVCKQPKVRKK